MQSKVLHCFLSCWPGCDQMAVCRGTQGFGGQSRAEGSKQGGAGLPSPASAS